MSIKAYYYAQVGEFLEDDPQRIPGMLTEHHHHALEELQQQAWIAQNLILKEALLRYPHGELFLELYIPRMGKRVDAALIVANIVFLIEFKINATAYLCADLNQVWDYALDLKNFHQGSHAVPIVPILSRRRRKRELRRASCFQWIWSHAR